ncbi:unnamed protein product [Amoebophrya sp. A120]|nr:unnamed protein product [Amoebophrya sp. A120]|eukprot:GSA120T00011315001.1
MFSMTSAIDSRQEPLLSAPSTGTGQAQEQARGTGSKFAQDLYERFWPLYEKAGSIAVACFLPVGVHYSQQLDGLKPFFSADERWSPRIDGTYWGLLQTTYTSPNLIIPLFAGVLVDNLYRPASVCLLFLCITFSGQLIFACATFWNCFPLLFVGRFVSGSGEGCIALMSSAILANAFFQQTGKDKVPTASADTSWSTQQNAEEDPESAAALERKTIASNAAARRRCLALALGISELVHAVSNTMATSLAVPVTDYFHGEYCAALFVAWAACGFSLVVGLLAYRYQEELGMDRAFAPAGAEAGGLSGMGRHSLHQQLSPKLMYYREVSQEADAGVGTTALRLAATGSSGEVVETGAPGGAIKREDGSGEDVEMSRNKGPTPTTALPPIPPSFTFSRQTSSNSADATSNRIDRSTGSIRDVLKRPLLTPKSCCSAGSAASATSSPSLAGATISNHPTNLVARTLQRRESEDMHTVPVLFYPAEPAGGRPKTDSRRPSSDRLDAKVSVSGAGKPPEGPVSGRQISDSAESSSSSSTARGGRANERIAGTGISMPPPASASQSAPGPNQEQKFYQTTAAGATLSTHDESAEINPAVFEIGSGMISSYPPDSAGPSDNNPENTQSQIEWWRQFYAGSDGFWCVLIFHGAFSASRRLFGHVDVDFFATQYNLSLLDAGYLAGLQSSGGVAIPILVGIFFLRLQENDTEATSSSTATSSTDETKAGSFSSRLRAGALSRKLKIVSLSLLIFCAFLMAFSYLWFAFAWNPVELPIFALMLVSGIEPTVLKSLVPLTTLHLATAFGCFETVECLVKTFGGPTVGALRDEFGNYSVDLLIFAFVLLSAALFGCIYLYRFVVRINRRSKESGEGEGAVTTT